MVNVTYGKCYLWQTYYGKCNYGKYIIANVTEPNKVDSFTCIFVKVKGFFEMQTFHEKNIFWFILLIFCV